MFNFLQGTFLFSHAETSLWRKGLFYVKRFFSWILGGYAGNHSDWAKNNIEAAEDFHLKVGRKEAYGSNVTNKLKDKNFVKEMHRICDHYVENMPAHPDSVSTTE